MVIRTAFLSMLLLAVGANAQSQTAPRGRGPGGGGPRLIGAEAGIPGRVVENAPYSAEIVTEMTQVLPEGNRIKRTNTVRVYRDSEGRVRREQSLRTLNGLAVAPSNSDAPRVAFISDPVAGSTYALDLANRTATRSKWRGGNTPGARRAGEPGGWMRGPKGEAPSAGGGMRRRDNPNVRTESLGNQSIEGVLAEGTRTTLTIPAGTIGNELALQVVDESWYSPDLKAVVLRKHSDPRSGETVTRYTNINRAEPARALFEPPADFKVSDSARQPNQ